VSTARFLAGAFLLTVYSEADVAHPAVALPIRRRLGPDGLEGVLHIRRPGGEGLDASGSRGNWLFVLEVGVSVPQR
jgi:hypothetical protein